MSGMDMPAETVGTAPKKVQTIPIVNLSPDILIQKLKVFNKT